MSETVDMYSTKSASMPTSLKSLDTDLGDG